LRAINADFKRERASANHYTWRYLNHHRSLMVTRWLRHGESHNIPSDTDSSKVGRETPGQLGCETAFVFYRGWHLFFSRPARYRPTAVLFYRTHFYISGLGLVRAIMGLCALIGARSPDVLSAGGVGKGRFGNRVRHASFIAAVNVRIK
jgi:hypothetical protein